MKLLLNQSDIRLLCRSLEVVNRDGSSLSYSMQIIELSEIKNSGIFENFRMRPFVHEEEATEYFAFAEVRILDDGLVTLRVIR